MRLGVGTMRASRHQARGTAPCSQAAGRAGLLQRALKPRIPPGSSSLEAASWRAEWRCGRPPPAVMPPPLWLQHAWRPIGAAARPVSPGSLLILLAPGPPACRAPQDGHSAHSRQEREEAHQALPAPSERPQDHRQGAPATAWGSMAPPAPAASRPRPAAAAAKPCSPAFASPFCRRAGGAPRVLTPACAGSSRDAASSCLTSATAPTRRPATCCPTVSSPCLEFSTTPLFPCHVHVVQNGTVAAQADKTSQQGTEQLCEGLTRPRRIVGSALGAPCWRGATLRYLRAQQQTSAPQQYVARQQAGQSGAGGAAAAAAHPACAALLAALLAVLGGSSLLASQRGSTCAFLRPPALLSVHNPRAARQLACLAAPHGPQPARMELAT